MAKVPRLSIVIPCVGGAAEFDGTLVSVLQHRPADCEVVVLHTEQYDDPYDLQDEVEFRRSQHQTVVELVNEGLAAVTGDIVHVLGCGVEATEGWADSAIPHFDDPQVATVSPLVMAAGGAEITSAGVRYSLGGTRRVVTDRRLLLPGTSRLKASILGPALTAGFYRRDILVALDGFDSKVGDRFADIDLALSLQALEQLNVCEPASRVIAASEPQPRGAQRFALGRQAQRLFWRHRSSGAALALHPVSICLDLLSQGLASGLATLAGRAVATLERGAARAQQERISQARQRLQELAELRATVRMPAERRHPAAALRRAA